MKNAFLSFLCAAPLSASAAGDLRCSDIAAEGYEALVKALSSAVVSTRSEDGTKPLVRMTCRLAGPVARPELPHNIAKCAAKAYALSIDAGPDGTTIASLWENGRNLSWLSCQAK